MNKPVKNIAASVRQKLTNLAKKSKRPFAELLQYYAMERFLYRLSRSEYKDRLVLKGALMFVAWGTPRSRATADIDLLARTDNSIANLVKVTRAICRIEVEADGLVFDPALVKGETIKEAIAPIKEFLVPIAEAGMTGRTFSMRWTAPGPWKAK